MSTQTITTVRLRSVLSLRLLPWFALLAACGGGGGGGDSGGGGGGGTQALTLSFGTPQVLSAGQIGGNAQVVITEDFDRDGDLDIAVANTSDNNVGVFINNGDGTFKDQVTYASGNLPVAIGTGLFDAGIDLDLVTANSGTNNASFLPNSGANGVFDARQDTKLGTTPSGLAVADFDGDSDLDVAFPDAAANLKVLLNTNFVFTLQTNDSNGKLTGPRGAVAADFSGDGRPDVAITDFGDERVVVWTNSGNAAELFPDANIQNNLTLPIGASSQGIAAGDLNKDGNVDIVVPNAGTANISVFLNQGGGNFSAGTVIAGGGDSFQAAVGDFNQDGNPDVVVLEFLTGNICVLLGNGDGTFESQKTFTVGTDAANATIQPRSVAVGDFNGDGKPDVVIASDLQKVISVLLNTSN